MDVLRRNTDYGLRMMAALAEHFNNGQLTSARQLASDGHFSYQLGCKLLQKLHRAQLVKSGISFVLSSALSSERTLSPSIPGIIRNP